MTHGEIYEKAYRLKAFQVWELIEELLKDWGFLGKKFVKDRVKSWLAIQLRHGALVKVSSNPPIFAFPEFAQSWEEYLRYRTCPVCSKEFLPSQPTQELCSPSCRQKHYKAYHRERRKKLRMKLDSKRRWTEEEVRILIQLREEGKSWEEIARALGRGKEGVKDKFKRLRKMEVRR